MRSVWKLLVASCVCLAEVWKRFFNVFVSCTKVFISSTIKAFVFYLEIDLGTPPQKNYRNKGKSFCKTSSQVGLDLKEVQNLGMRWKNTRRLTYICTFFRSIPTWKEVLRKLFPSHHYALNGLLWMWNSVCLCLIASFLFWLFKLAAWLIQDYWLPSLVLKFSIIRSMYSG